MIGNWWGKIRLIVMLSPQKLVLLLFITVSVLSLCFQIVSYWRAPSDSPSSLCIEQKKTLLQEIAAAGLCNNDADCVLLKANCPFNCLAVHQDYTTSFTHKTTDYSKQCGFCVAECVPVHVPVCREHRCVVPLP